MIISLDKQEKMASNYFERLKIAEGVPTRIALLSKNAIGKEFHWVDNGGDIKGSFECCKGECCKAFSAPRQSYNFIVYKFVQPSVDASGQVYLWSLTPSQYTTLLGVAAQADLLQYDLMVNAVKRGKGTDITFSIIPNASYRTYWDNDTRAAVDAAVLTFFDTGESTISNPMSPITWQAMLSGMGWDFVNHCWNQTPMQPAYGQVGGGAFPSAPTRALPQPPQAFNVGQAMSGAVSHSQGFVPQTGAFPSASAPQFPPSSTGIPVPNISTPPAVPPAITADELAEGVAIEGHKQEDDFGDIPF